MTRESLRRTGLTADQAIAQLKQASIRRVFPAQMLHLTIDEIEQAAREGDRPAKTALKLLTDRRFDKL